MGKTINTAVIIFLMILSGIFGYKVGNFKVSVNKKIIEEADKLRKTIDQIQAAHKVEIEKIETDYKKKLSAANMEYEKKKELLESTIKNKDAEISELDREIDEKKTK